MFRLLRLTVVPAIMDSNIKLMNTVPRKPTTMMPLRSRKQLGNAPTIQIAQQSKIAGAAVNHQSAYAKGTEERDQEEDLIFLRKVCRISS